MVCVGKQVAIRRPAEQQHPAMQAQCALKSRSPYAGLFEADVVAMNIEHQIAVIAGNGGF